MVLCKETSLLSCVSGFHCHIVWLQAKAYHRWGLESMISKHQLLELMTQGPGQRRCGPLSTQNLEEVDRDWMP